MALTATIPSYCTNCQHNKVCRILINIASFEEKKATFNTERGADLQSISTVNYNCGFKLKTP